MTEFGGLWRQQNNPACTKSVSLDYVEVVHYTQEDEVKARQQGEDSVICSPFFFPSPSLFR